MADGEGDCYIGNTDNLRFCIDGIDVNFESFFAASGRADRFRIYRISNERKLENKTLKIIHEGASYNFKLTVDDLIDERVRISATTIFKDDYRLLGPYISHYRKLGVHCFDLYYNGKINDLLIRQDFDRFVVSVTRFEDAIWAGSLNLSLKLLEFVGARENLLIRYQIETINWTRQISSRCLAKFLYTKHSHGKLIPS